MADLIVGIVGYVLRHVFIEICQCRQVRRISGVRIVVLIYRPSEFVVLLPKVGFYQLDSGSKSQYGGVASG